MLNPLLDLLNQAADLLNPLYNLLNSLDYPHAEEVRQPFAHAR